MIVTRLRLTNWRNFREADVPLHDRTYLLGANASGKSNLLDVFRFLRDICRERGGGLQAAVDERGGLSRIRCLHARKHPEVRIEVELRDSVDAASPLWRYALGITKEARGNHRTLVTEERVYRGDDPEPILDRPDAEDKHDSARLTQTHLEQIQANQPFRAIADFFGRVLYLHLVPQLLTHADQLGGQRPEDDPFGQGFLERIAVTPKRTRDARLARIGTLLKVAVPQFDGLRFVTDSTTGRPHLEARYRHFRPGAGWQREDQFSDGTLRLTGLLWALLEGESLLLLEEPELSLNDAIVEHIPALFDGLQRGSKRKRQVILSTHSAALTRNPGIDPRGVLVLRAGKEGSVIAPLTQEDEAALDAGFSVAEVVLPQTRPDRPDQLFLPQV